MPRHFEKRTLPYSPAQIFDLVADIESYPAFLPWCQRAVIIERGGTENIVADLVVGNHVFLDSFRSHVALDRPRSITVTYGGGSLKHLSNVWHFDSAPEGACEVSFVLDFSVSSVVLGALMNAFFDKAFCRMVQAFEQRAFSLYGDKTNIVTQP